MTGVLPKPSNASTTAGGSSRKGDFQVSERKLPLESRDAVSDEAILQAVRAPLKTTPVNPKGAALFVATALLLLLVYKSRRRTLINPLHTHG